MDFETQDVRFGEDLDYDIVDGFLSELLADSGFDRSTCAAPVWPAPPFVDGRVPPVGDAYYYLVRVNGPAGVGTHGDGRPRARTNARDPLDETPVVCP